MRGIIIIIALLFGISVYSQYNDPYYTEVRATADPSVFVIEGNLNIKIEFSSHFNNSNNWRVNVVAETLTGHGGYYSGSIGTGFSIPYRVGGVNLRVEPSISIGVIYRPNMYVLAVHDLNGSTYSNKGYYGTFHSLSLRHSIQIGKSRWSGYIHSRLIHRSDLHYSNSLTLTPESLPYYNYDNAIGISYKFN